MVNSSKVTSAAENAICFMSGMDVRVMNNSGVSYLNGSDGELLLQENLFE